MAMCAIAVGDVVTVSNESPGNCSQYTLLSQSDWDMARNPFGHDPDFSIVYWSSGATLLMWAIGLGAGAVFSMIRKAR